jgi:hypothetical protein
MEARPDLRAGLGGPLVLPAMVAFVALCAFTISGVARNHQRIAKARADLTWLALAYAAYIAFVIWWDPRDLKWSIIPNLFLIGGFARAWAMTPGNRRQHLAIAACVGVMAPAATSRTRSALYIHGRIRASRCVAESRPSPALGVPSSAGSTPATAPDRAAELLAALPGVTSKRARESSRRFRSRAG